MLHQQSDPVLQANLRKAEEQVSKLDMDARNAREEADNLRRRLLNSEALAHTLEANEQRALQREKNATEQQHQLRAELEAMHKLHAEQAQVSNLGAPAVQCGAQLHVHCGGSTDCVVHGGCVGSQHKLHMEQGGVLAPVCRQVRVEQAVGVAQVCRRCCRASLCMCRDMCMTSSSGG